MDACRVVEQSSLPRLRTWHSSQDPGSSAGPAPAAELVPLCHSVSLSLPEQT